MKEARIRRVTRRVLREEVSPGDKSEALNQMKDAIRSEMDRILLAMGIERKGFSRQQAALMYRELCATIEDVIDQYSTITVRDADLRRVAQSLEDD